MIFFFQCVKGRGKPLKDEGENALHVATGMDCLIFAKHDVFIILKLAMFKIVRSKCFDWNIPP